MRRAHRVGVLAERGRTLAGVKCERARPGVLAVRRGAPGARQAQLERERLVPEREAVELRDRAARAASGSPACAAAWATPAERPGEHPDGVGIAQQRGAFAAQAQRPRDPAAREPDEPE